jgi:hypothetical protein
MDREPAGISLDQEPRLAGQGGFPVVSAGEFHSIAVRRIEQIMEDGGGCAKATKQALSMLEDRGVLTNEEVELLQSLPVPPGSDGADVLERVRAIHDQFALRKPTSPLAVALTSVALNVDGRNFNALFGSAVAGALIGTHVGDGYGLPVESAIVGAAVGSAVMEGIGASQ